MSVRAVSLFQPRDGKREDSLREASQAKEHLTRFSARFRLGEMVFGGANHGPICGGQLEFGALAAYADFMQTANANENWRDFQKKAERAGGTLISVSRSLVQDVL